MNVSPITLKAARLYVGRVHRHHKPPHTPSRPRIDQDEWQARFRWEIAA